MSKDLLFRRLQLDEDLEELLQLFEIVFNRVGSLDIWRWKYLPPWARQPYAWIALLDNEIVGHVGAVRLRGRANGEDISFFQIGDVMVHPRFRGAIHNLAMVHSRVHHEIRTECPSALVYGFAGKRAARFYEWIGISAILEEAEDRLIRMNGETAADSRAVNVRQWDWSEASLDVLWDDLQDTVPVGLLRDRQYLTWRYANHPTL